IRLLFLQTCVILVSFLSFPTRRSSDLSEIISQQGEDACVYPAPKFYLEDTACGSHRIHIRPPFWKSCDIKANDETREALEYAGFDPLVVDEVHDERQNVYDYWLQLTQDYPDYSEDGRSGAELAQYKADQYADNRL